MHNAPAAPFFQAGAAHVNGRPEGQALLSYLLGFLCHFALDSECHSYIEYEIGRSGHRHVAIETALDGALMEKDGVETGAPQTPRATSWSAKPPPAPSPALCRQAGNRCASA